MKLKLATMADLSLLARWYKELREDERIDNVMTDDEICAQMDSFLRGEIYKSYFLEVEDKVVGYGMLDITRTPKYLRHLYIDRGYRRQGHGKHLITMLMAKYQIQEIDIDVMVWNKNALEFYNKLGFKSRYVGMRLCRDAP